MIRAENRSQFPRLRNGPEITSRFSVDECSAQRNRPTTFTLCHKVSDPSGLPPRFVRVEPRGRDGTIENCRNKADCSGVCRCQITVYDKSLESRRGALRADESRKPLLISTERSSSTGQVDPLQGDVCARKRVPPFNLSAPRCGKVRRPCDT